VRTLVNSSPHKVDSNMFECSNSTTLGRINVNVIHFSPHIRLSRGEVQISYLLFSAYSKIKEENKQLFSSSPHRDFASKFN